MSGDVDILIVGGGAAGVGAARRLAGSGFSSRVLEASARLGGRACTHEIAGRPLDLGCGWLHSADRNGWVKVARERRVEIDKSKAAWGAQFRNLDFSPAEHAEAWSAFDAWTKRLSKSPPPSDCAADALDEHGQWNDHIRAIAGYISGAKLERLSAADYAAYDEASSDDNWRVRTGYGSLIAQGFPGNVALSLATPVDSLAIDNATLIESPSVPEPASLSVLGMGVAGLMLRRRRAR